MTGSLDSKRCLGWAAGTVGLLWAAQPPLGFWPLAWLALVPSLFLVTAAEPLPRFFYRSQWLAATGFWLVSLQGLRHAHPLMFLCWIALAGYLAIYFPLFVFVARRLAVYGVPLVLAVPISWVGWEAVRNYALTGISAAMLGHTMAEVPSMIQIADLFGSYGVGFVIAAANVACFYGWQRTRRGLRPREVMATGLVAAALVLAALGYGHYRLGQPLGPPLGTIALIQRDEQTEYAQDQQREREIFQNYAEETLEAIQATDASVDVVVWPESMFSGGMPWMESTATAAAPLEYGYSDSEFRGLISENQQLFLQRARNLQQALAAWNADGDVPALVGGCAVVRYESNPQVYSGVVQVTPEGQLGNWYGKSHLVMFGEYIPLIGSVPALRNLVPPGMGLQVGQQPQLFSVGSMRLCPNICIETAVERVTVNQMSRLQRSTAPAAKPEGPPPDVIVNVTNDAWFDGSSVVAHHLRCAQLVAVGCRRPLLIAGNGGPTAWIDSNGEVVERLGFHDDGWIIARPQQDVRSSLYVRIGDLPAKGLAILVCLVLAESGVARRRRGKVDIPTHP